MHERKQKLMNVAWLATGLLSAGLMAGCTSYGGSVPIDNDAGYTGKEPKPGSMNASVPIDDDAGLQKKTAEPKP